MLRKEVFDRVIEDSKEEPDVVFGGDSLTPANTLPYYCDICVEEFQVAENRRLDDRESHDVVFAALIETEPREGVEGETFLLARRWCVICSLDNCMDIDYNAE